MSRFFCGILLPGSRRRSQLRREGVLGRCVVNTPSAKVDGFSGHARIDYAHVNARRPVPGPLKDDF